MLVREAFLGLGADDEATPHIQVVGTTHAGVEIELENISNINLNTDYWQSISDGSLRSGGREFVFNGPKAGKDLFLACVELDTFLSKQQPDGHWRCSTHVHVDMRDVSVQGLKNTILGYLVFEKFLFRLSGFHRYSNNFCAALGFAQNQLNTLSSAWGLSDEEFLHQIVHEWDKYSALNLKPLSRFGTIEFRSSAAEWRRGKLIRLVNRFLALRDFCVNWEGSEQDLVSYLSSVEPKEIFKKGMTSRDLPEGWSDDVVVGSKLAYDLLAFTATRGTPQTLSFGSVTDDWFARSAPVEFRTSPVPPPSRPTEPPIRTFHGEVGGVDLPLTHKRVYIEALEQALGIVAEDNAPEGMLGFNFLELVFNHTDYSPRSLTSEARIRYQEWEDSR